jgi:hypothetical protein
MKSFVYLSHAEVCIVESLKHVAVLIDGLGEQVVGQVQEVQPGECRQNVHNLARKKSRLCKSNLLTERYKASCGPGLGYYRKIFEEFSWQS